MQALVHYSSNDFEFLKDLGLLVEPPALTASPKPTVDSNEDRSQGRPQLADSMAKVFQDRYWKVNVTIPPSVGHPANRVDPGPEVVLAVVLLGQHGGSDNNLIRWISEFLSEQTDNLNRAVVLAEYFPDQAQEITSELDNPDPLYAVVMHRGSGQPLSELTQIRRLQVEIDYILENQAENPSVGYGLLVYDSSGSFLARRRSEKPEHGTIGTIGAAFARGKTLEESVRELPTDKFTAPKPAQLRQVAQQISVGQLLAATNFSDGTFHYIDLTFLASHQGRFSSKLRFRSTEMLKDNRGHVSVATSFEHLAAVYLDKDDDELFTPVRNAFASFCRLLSIRGIRGPSRTDSFPALNGISRLPIPPALKTREALRLAVEVSALCTETNPFSEVPFYESMTEAKLP